MQEINNSMESFNKFVLEIFDKYEMIDAYYILNGVNLVSIKNCQIWLRLVEQMQDVKGLDFLPNCLALMKKIDKNILVNAIASQENPSYESFENFLLGLSDTIEAKSISK